MHKSIYRLISLMYIAKKLVLGYDDIYQLLSTNKIYAIIISSNLSFKTQKKIQTKAFNYHIPIYILDESDYSIAQAIGKKNVAMIGILDQGFSNKIKNYM